MRADVLIVGAGQAGAQAAISLRQGGFAGSILLVGDEDDLPYERPPLSKDYLAGEKEAARLPLRPADFWAERNIQIRTATRIERIDAHAHQAITSAGEAIDYGTLVWAAGGYPRPLPVAGADLAGVHVIRSRAQTDALRADLETVSNVVIVGGGYIGLESAAVLAKAGKRVTIIEAQERVLARVAAEPISRFYEAEHRAHGVDVRTSTGVSFLKGDGTRISHLVTGDGDEVPADVVIVGIGLVPSQGVLAQAGAECSNGIEVDELCRTTLPDVFAIGDCACHPNPYAGGTRVRLESVQNAIDQAKTVAGVILGDSKPYRALPWFWSNQYDLKLQTAGLSHGYDETVLRGDPAMGSFSLIYLRQKRVAALACVNATRDFIAGKTLIETGAVVAPGVLADTSIPLKGLISTRPSA